MKHWLQLVAIPNPPVAEITQGVLNQLSALEDLRAGSRSPRRHQQARTLPAITEPLFLALPASSSGQLKPPTPKSKAKGNKRGSKQQKGNRNSGNGGTKKFAGILATGGSQALPRKFLQQGALFPVSERHLQDG